jgi:hypothetical protein
LSPRGKVLGRHRSQIRRSIIGCIVMRTVLAFSILITMIVLIRWSFRRVGWWLMIVVIDIIIAIIPHSIGMIVVIYLFKGW